MTWSGTLLHIHTCPAGGQGMTEQMSATCIAGVGIEGDRYATGTGHYSKLPDIREITLIEIGTLTALNRDHGITLMPHQHRRNLTVEAVPLNHLVGKRFTVGDVVLEGGRLNTPCVYLDKLVGQPVCKKLWNRSGLNCHIIEGGSIQLGMTIQPV